MADWVGIKYATNSTLGTSNFSPIDEIIKNGNSSLASSLYAADNHVQSLRGGVQRFTADGTFTVPANITKVWITACAGGQHGGSDYGGYGGDWLFREPYSVSPGQKLTITVGNAGTKSGEIGGSTIISPLVTLSCPGTRGGAGGKSDGHNSPYCIHGTAGYAAGGTGSTVFSSQIFIAKYFGGGGSLGRGGGASATQAGYGGGGLNNMRGGDGIVIIEW